MAENRESNREEQSLRTPGREVEHITPSVDIYETDAEHVLLADMPGVSRDGLEIHVDRDRLTIRGRVAQMEAPQPQHREFGLHDYYRAFTLADDIDTDKITANLTDGVLRLVLPKSSRARVRKIPVSAH
jgi:HSP20 family molecular chaperone IbpA